MKKRNREERKDRKISRKKRDLGISIVFNSGVEN